MRWVMLHGLGQTPESWKIVVQTAGLKTEACCPNLADWLGGGDYSGLYQGLEEYCDRMDAPFFLSGLSLGGVLALQYAAEHPDRVAALALIGAQYVMPKRLLKVQNLLFSLLPEGMFGERKDDRPDRVYDGTGFYRGFRSYPLSRLGPVWGEG